MGMFTVIPENTFNALQLDAGVLLKTFNPVSPSAPADENLITATTGGITVACVPTYADLGEDVDNCPNNLKEFKILTGWDCKLTTTGIGTSPELIRLALGCADVDNNTITPRADISQGDFSDLWWVGDKADGGMVAVKITNALSTGGFSLKTTKGGKGQTSIELTGHVSINNQKVVPMTFYSTNGTAIVITQQPSQIIIKPAGTAAAFNVEASGGLSALSYQWQVMAVGESSFQDISGKTHQTLTIGPSEVTTSANGNKYRCVITDGTNTAYSNYGTLVVTE